MRSQAGTNGSAWSNVVRVIGGYYDDFSDPSTGWDPVRRMTYLEKTDVKYGKGNEAGYLIMLTFDKWDWAIASPLVPAPEVPYDITYRGRVHMDSDQNLISGGMVFGGDWNGGACPEYGNVYQTDNCFNHFYLFNYIWHGPMKLLYEQANWLYYCPSCGGSQIKRRGPEPIGIDNVLANGNPALNWHNYRVEVRDSGVTLYIDDHFVRTFSDTTWINEPYFGVFTSADEYQPSIWFFDYFELKPVD